MINKYLKQYFEENNISQLEIEKLTGISQSKISLFLNCKRKLTADELIKIAIVFDINLESIKKEIKNACQQNWFLKVNGEL